MPATKHPDVFRSLGEPFEAGQVRSRNQAGRQLHYISARTAMIRLDEVLGPENWRDEFTETKDGLRCRIWFRVPGTEEWGWKEDGGAGAGMPDADNEEKSAYSDAFKRAAVKLGVGRYLYQDGTANHGGDCAKSAVEHRPEPARQIEHRPEPPRAPAPANDRPAESRGAPRSGGALYAWCKEQEEKHGKGLIRYMDEWAKGAGFPFKMMEWDASMVAAGHAEAIRAIETKGASASEPAKPEASRGTGKDLHNTARKLEREHNGAFVAALIEWGNNAKIPGPMVEWQGEALADAWRELDRISPAGKPAAPKFSGLKRDIMAKAEEHLRIVHGDKWDAARFSVKDHVTETFASAYPGESLGSLKDFDNEAQLIELSKIISENIAEAKDDNSIPF